MPHPIVAAGVARGSYGSGAEIAWANRPIRPCFGRWKRKVSPRWWNGPQYHDPSTTVLSEPRCYRVAHSF